MEPAELIRVWIDEVWHSGHLERVVDCVGDTYIRHDRGGNRIVTWEQYAEEIRQVRLRLPDIHFWIDDLLVSSDRIWARYRRTGTDAATGEATIVSGLQVYRVAGGKLVETWNATAPDGHDWSAPIE